jgi:TonB family protein
MKRLVIGAPLAIIGLLTFSCVASAQDVHQITETGLKPPTLIENPKPRYTSQAMDDRIEGDVLMQVVVQPDGRVGAVKILRSLDAGLDQEAVTAIKQWRFNPAVKDGQAVAVLVTVEMAFKLGAPYAIEPELRAEIEMLMEETGAVLLGTQTADFMSAQFIDQLRKQAPISDRAIEVIKEVLAAEFVKAFQGANGLNAKLVVTYAKHFTRDDIRDLRAFYRSAIGKKAIAVMPTIIEESIAAAAAWARANDERITSVLLTRLKAEGLLR